MFQIEINNQQAELAIDGDRIVHAMEMVLAEEGVEAATVSIGIVDDPTIHDLNRRFLDHDEPTDVLSFLLEEEEGRLEGDVIVSADTAVRTAAQLQWPAGDELLLYIVHGTLHLVGYDDLEPEAQAQMRDREQHYLRALGLQSPAFGQANDSLERSPEGQPEFMLSHES